MGVLTRVMGYAYDRGIAVELHTDWPADWPSVSYPSRRLIVANVASVRPREVPFMVAHEIGHVLDGDDDGLLYTSNAREKSETERDADRTAIRVLYSLCREDEDFSPEYFNPVQFMENFMVPECYRDYVSELGGKRYV